MSDDLHGAFQAALDPMRPGLTPGVTTVYRAARWRRRQRRATETFAVITMIGLGVAATSLLYPASNDSGKAVLAQGAPATATVNGLSLSLTLDQQVAGLGQVVTGVATLENTSDHKVFWNGGSCQAPEQEPEVYVSVQTALAHGDTPADARLAAFKRDALTSAPGSYAFLNSGQPAGLKVACTSESVTRELLPGGKLTRQLSWVAQTPADTAIDGDVPVSAHFFFSSAPQEQASSITASASLHLTGGESQRLTAGMAIDAALRDPTFATAVMNREASTIGRLLPGVASGKPWWRVELVSREGVDVAIFTVSA